MLVAADPPARPSRARHVAAVARWAIAVAILLVPVVFVTVQFQRNGILYTFTEGDIWEGYAPGLRLLTHEPTRTYFLTEDVFLWKAGEDNGPPYTHNSWMVPRLVSVLWYVVGFKQVLWNIHVSNLFVYAVVAACALVMLRAHFWAALLAVAFLNLDFFGYLRFIADAPLGWYPALTGMVVVAAFAPPRWGYAIGFLALFLVGQHMIPYAIFLVAVAASLPLLTLAVTGRAPAAFHWRWFWAAAGFGLSLGIFLLQLLLYYGVDGLWQDLTTTLAARNSGGVETAPRAFSELLSMYAEQRRPHSVPADLFQFVRHTVAAVLVQYHWLQVLLMAAGLAWLPMMLGVRLVARWRGVRAPEVSMDTALLGAVAWAMVVGYLASAVVLRGQTYILHLLHFGPMLVFGLAAAFALSTLLACRWLYAAVQRAASLWVAQAAVAMLAILAVGAGALASVRNAEVWTAMDGQVFWEISKPEYAGQRLMISQGGPLFALAWLISGEHPYRADAPATQRTNDRWGMPTHYICLDHWNLGNAYGETCHAAAQSLVEMGHGPARLEPNWAIVKLNPRGKFPRTR